MTGTRAKQITPCKDILKGGPIFVSWYQLRFCVDAERIDGYRECCDADAPPRIKVDMLLLWYLVT